MTNPTTAPRKKPSFFQRALEQWDLQLLVIPGILLLFVFSYIPIYGLVMAFQEYRIGDFPGQSEWVGFKQFISLFTDKNLPIVLRNTLAISGLKLTIGFVCPIVFAVFLNEMHLDKTKKVIQTISYLPHFISWTVCALLLFDFLKADGGAVNEMLVAIGILKEPIDFFGRGDLFWGIALISDIWKELGWNSIIFISAMAGVDAEMYEAADIDGATRAQKMWHITIKAIRPTIVLLFIMNVGGILNQNFDQIMMLTKQMGNPLLKETANVIDTYIFQVGISQSRASFGTAAGLVKSIINFVLLIAANTIADKAGENALF
ncbi:ABC transporter permease [Acutalibacter caecimuris]|uniref:ABC transporter permease n=1 Tax=Acutalibacter caecimuris TaxID=3093657 RepID=UPI002AC9DE2E|nr:ABC transporter permease subunit [Acutalibacter sp. M00118]